MQLTFEQLDILDQENTNLIINAGAGSGKTSTLKAYTEKYSDKKFLYLCYNKSIKEYAQKIFPKNNVKTQTFHSLGFIYAGKSYDHRLNNNLTTEQIITFLNLQENFSRYRLIGELILNTIKNYCASQEKFLETSHIDLNYLEKYMFLNGKTEDEINVLLEDILIEAKKVWKEVIKPESLLGFDHDFYLKILCNDAPVMSKYDYILIDEAQDLTPCFVDFINNQKIPVILVGDKHQSIYSWRGAINYIDYIQKNNNKNYITKNLSTSFRFGPKIATLANTSLNLLESDMLISGYDKIDNLVYSYKDIPEIITSIKDDEKINFISRSNIEIYDTVIYFINKKIPIYVEGGLNYNEIREIDDFLKFKKGIKTNNMLYNSYKDYNELDVLIQKGEIKDHDIKKRYFLLNKWGNSADQRIKQLKEFWAANKENKNTDSFKYIITIVHKAKGKEYDNLVLLDDFNSSLNPDSSQNIKLLYERKNNDYVNKTVEFNNKKKEATACISLPKNQREIEELNILYVAITRAKKKIFIPASSYKSIKSVDLVFNGDLNADKFLFDNAINMMPNVRATIEKQKLKIEINKINELKIKENIIKKINKI